MNIFFIILIKVLVCSHRASLAQYCAHPDICLSIGKAISLACFLPYFQMCMYYMCLFDQQKQLIVDECLIQFFKYTVCKYGASQPGRQLAK